MLGYSICVVCPYGVKNEDNYFDLMPGREKIVRVLGDHRHGLVTAKAWYSPHVTKVQWQR
jgi:beta-mannosidase